MDVISILNGFATSHPWVPMSIAIFLVISTAIKGIRDAIDKTPQSDDNWFERLATIITKAAGYLAGIRPKAPDDVKAVPGSTVDATGVKVK